MLFCLCIGNYFPVATASVLPGHYIDAIEGQMTSIPCGLDKVTKDSSLKWKRNQVDPTKDSRFTLNPTSGALVINRVNRKDAGSYNCTIMTIKNGQLKFMTNQMYFNVQCESTQLFVVKFALVPNCSFNLAPIAFKITPLYLSNHSQMWLGNIFQNSLSLISR